MKKIMFIIFFINFYSCHNDNYKNSWNLKDVEYSLGEDCNGYALIFDAENEFIFRVAQSGRCKKLEYEEYVNFYISFLSDNSKNIVKRDGKIIFEKFYGKEKEEFSSTVLIDSTIKYMEGLDSLKVVSQDEYQKVIELFFKKK